LIAASLLSLPVLTKSDRLRSDLRERVGQLHDTARNHAGKEVQRAVAAPFDGGDDVRMVVADGRAHLAGREVEDLPACRVEDVAALRTLDNFGIRVAAVADQVLAEIAARFVRLTHRWLLACMACIGESLPVRASVRRLAL